ncbi:MAG: hypothetical protein ACM3RP_07080 [Chitinophagales bacterium]
MALHDWVQWANLFYQGIYLADRVSNLARRSRVPYGVRSGAGSGTRSGEGSVARSAGQNPGPRSDWRYDAGRMIGRAHSLLDFIGHDED